MDGAEYEISESSAKYTEKIARLCKENGVRLVFLTIPMYPEHVKNYPVWQERLGAHLKGLSPYWLDLQAAQVTDSTLRSLYTTAAFQDTYGANQHLTNYGMAVNRQCLRPVSHAHHAGHPRPQKRPSVGAASSPSSPSNQLPATIHLSIFLLWAEKLMPIFRTLRESEAKGAA